MPMPPSDGNPLPVPMKLRQHEVQAVLGSSGCIALAWTDDTSHDDTTALECGRSVIMSDSDHWSKTAHYKNNLFDVTTNPAIATDNFGNVFVTVISVMNDYSYGIIEFCHSRDLGRSWSDWRPILARSNGIPDRPKIALATNGGIFIIYSDVQKQDRFMKPLVSEIKIISSNDKGLTWTKPRTISPPYRRSKWLIDGYQGPDMEIVPKSGHRLLSWGEYYGKKIYFGIDKDGDKDSYRPSAIVLKPSLRSGLRAWLLGAAFGTPATELALDVRGRSIAIAAYEAHTFGRIEIITSMDQGRHWDVCRTLTYDGLNPSAVIDGNQNIHVMWTEFSKGAIDTCYAISEDFGRTFRPMVSLAGGRKPAVGFAGASVNSALMTGSYQSLLIDDKGKAYAFWIDFRNGMLLPRLYYSVWQI